MRLPTGFISRLRVHRKSAWVLALVCSLVAGTRAFGQEEGVRAKCEELLPDTSKLFVSVPNPSEFRELWRSTEMGKMFNDQVMEPFGKDLRAQLDKKLAQTDARLGLKFSDIEGIAGGEIAFAIVQPENKGRFYIVTMADVQGHHEQVEEVSKKVRQELTKRKGKNQTLKLDGEYEVSEWTFPPNQQNPEERKAFFATHKDWYLASDHQDILLALLHRLDGEGNDVLSKLPAYQAVMEGSKYADQPVQLRWFMDPFGLAESIRAADTIRERGRDRVQILKEQGFGAIEGIGGVMLVASEQYDFVFHTFIYAPKDKRILAARMLDFPSAPTLTTPDWALKSLSGFTAFNWEMIQAFDAVGTLIDAMADEEDVWKAVLIGIANDKNGLQIDIRKQIVANLGKRVYMATQTETPITPQSEQRLIAFELTDSASVAKLLKGRLTKDPTIHEKKFGDQIVWEIQNSKNARNRGGKGAFARPNRPAAGAGGPGAAGQKRQFFKKNGALTVAFGYLIYSTDVDFLGKFVTKMQDGEKLTSDPEFNAVEAALKQLDAQPDPFLTDFMRLESALQPNYELFKNGLMPKSETFLGQLLNSFLAPEDDAITRKPLIDGAKLPDYAKVKQYMMPGGFKGYTEENGWRYVGCILAREKRAAGAINKRTGTESEY